MQKHSFPYQNIVDRLHKLAKQNLERTATISRLETEVEQLSEVLKHKPGQSTLEEQLFKIRQEIGNLKKQEVSTPEVKRLRQKLLNLGVVERAYDDFEFLMETGSFYQAREAAWELALWHANKHTAEDAKQCLYLLRAASVAVEDTAKLQALAIIKLECFQLLGKKEEAHNTADEAIRKYPSADLYLAASNLENEIKNKIKWINKAFEHQNIPPINYESRSHAHYYDRLTSKKLTKKNRARKNNQPKVSVIIPAHNAAATIDTTLDSMLAQSWTNIEILVVDDCSTDDTQITVEQYAQKDNRVQYMKTEQNSGPYVARNIALKQTTGELITCSDADDWSHPEKIETQVKNLIGNPRLIANMSQWARANNDLMFHRRGNPGYYIQTNASSLMFWVAALKKIGHWDSVRFGADSEFIRRLTAIYGENSIESINRCLLSFSRKTPTSLTDGNAFGYQGFFMGARKEYRESQIHHHEKADSLYYDFPMNIRSFAVPDPMRIEREAQNNQPRHFNIVVAADFRLSDGTFNLEEIKRQQKTNSRLGITQLTVYELGEDISIAHDIREFINSSPAEMLVYGENIQCDTLIIRQPWSLQDCQTYLPNIETETVKIVADWSLFNDRSLAFPQNIQQIQHHLSLWIQNSLANVTWYPLTPTDRQPLLDYNKQHLEPINIAEENWQEN